MNISAPTASRDLQKAVEIKLLARIGDKNKTSYRKAKHESGIRSQQEKAISEKRLPSPKNIQKNIIR